MARRKRGECPFTLCGQRPKNGDIIDVGSERLLVLCQDDGWEIKPIVGVRLGEAKFTPLPPKPAGQFIIDAAGVARNSRGKSINPSDVTDVLYDMRPEPQRGDIRAVVWADGISRDWGELGGITVAAA